ncbi:hypothetical protein L198_00621 [Cryptococcus wingfieldii CBS 7118]|uniref:Formin GTPase-binding domain-containing protein n=1 Tax=Cryptococcus wingfieldii CBS 7118 TaxID=1295528 RepID=A0A1E3K6R7_9TREE|nr:hypothetical protein L198_00621 [Cryptococcus wingfieldii CBS 7118]ODO08884.1 hypothetical protein L198_00621 [Cryptococcus wingfieldii CBS 7118]
MSAQAPRGQQRPPAHIEHRPMRPPPAQPAAAQQRMSMPPPQSTSKPVVYSTPKNPQGYPQSMSRGLPRPAEGQSQQGQYLRESTKPNVSMPPPRQPSATMGHKDGKQPHATAWRGAQTVRERGGKGEDVEGQFHQLLDSLQVPETVRQKFSTVSQDVKSSILSSTLTSNPAILSSLGLPVPAPQSPKARKKLSTPLLRKTKSSGSLKDDQPQPNSNGVGKTYNVNGGGFVIVASPKAGSDATLPSPVFPNEDLRRQSIDSRPSRPSSRIFGHSPSASVGSNKGAKGLGIAMGEQPEAFIQWLKAYKGTDLRMDVGRCKKLRMLLRHESTDWVGAFLDMGGYVLVLDRLQDLLDVEWREEQHDDQMLYEILRCIKAFSTTEMGKAALRRSFPRPFPALSSLLFSEKKPGDLASRQLIVELWLFLFDLFAPPSSFPTPSPALSSSGRSIRFDAHAAPGSISQKDLTDFMRTLLVPEQENPTKDQHDFVTQAHRPRIFKAWVGELSDICRDYFWIMCHASNTLWALDQVDESLVEKPVAPGGATGGVEFEAMNYVTNHFKLLNAYAKRQAAEDIDKARQLHQDLMASGMDRILVTFRKASTTYYPSVHLELARYVAILRAASPDGKLPYLISKMVGPPPSEVAKQQHSGEWLPMPRTR